MNTLFVLITAFTTPGFPIDDVIYITSLIFSPTTIFPSEAWGTSGIVPLINGNPTDFTANFMVFIGLVIPPIGALIFASLLADKPKEAFGAVVITILLACTIYTILFGIGQGMSAAIAQIWADQTVLYGTLGTLIMILLGGVVNGFFYGAIAMFATKEGL
ncbi:MAG: hypothetical protein ACFE9R_19690 [Candidatus Hermodarchaeota archaeon]